MSLSQGRLWRWRRQKQTIQERGKFHYKKNYKGKKNFYSKEEDNSSSDISDVEVIFIGIEESNEIEEIEHKKESEDEVEVNMEK